MADYKRQHTVPEFYLHSFTDPEGMVWVFDKAADRTYRAVPRNVGFENRFFDVKAMADGPRIHEALERMFHTLETPTGAITKRVVEQLDNSDFDCLTTDDREILALYVALQWLRTCEARAHFVALYELINEVKFRAHLEGVNPELAGKPFRLRMGRDAHAPLHAALLLDPKMHGAITRILLSLTCLIITNSIQVGFCTSDQPVVLQQHGQRSKYRGFGFRSRGVEVAFPLSPRHMLLFVDPVAFHAYKHMSGRVAGHVQAENVEFYNSLQLRDSRRFTYSATDPTQFSQAYCNAFPISRDAERARVRVAGGPWPGLNTLD